MPPLPPPIALPGHAPEAALDGVAGASLAASHGERNKRPSSPDPAPGPALEPRGEVDSAEPSAGPRELVDLLWFHEEAPLRAREHRGWSELESGPESWITTGPPQPAPTPEPKLDVIRALTRIPTQDAVDAVKDSLVQAHDREGLFIRPVLVLGGELEMRFDPKDYLREMVAAATPFNSGDRRLDEALTTANKAAGPSTRLLPGATDALATQLTQAFGSAVKTMPPEYLHQTAERALLEEHRYASFLVLGSRHHGAYLTGNSKRRLPAYVPEQAAAMLPLLPRFSVRLLVEPHLQQDPDEAEALALRVLAIARTTPLD